MGLIFSGDGPVSLLLLCAGGLNVTHGASWFYRVASGTGSVGAVFLFILCGVDDQFMFIDLNSLCCCGMMAVAALPRLGVTMQRGRWNLVEFDGRRRLAGSPVISTLGGCVSCSIFTFFRVFPAMIKR
jgi:hypothetical protein